MKPADAEAAYNKEWPALNKRKVDAISAADPDAELWARRALSALSIKYDDRHKVKPEPPATLATYSELKSLLDECIEHLEYVNFGDSWEKECAEELIDKIDRYQEQN